jgi:hypothetical protein
MDENAVGGLVQEGRRAAKPCMDDELMRDMPTTARNVHKKWYELIAALVRSDNDSTWSACGSIRRSVALIRRSSSQLGARLPYGLPAFRRSRRQGAHSDCAPITVPITTPILSSIATAFGLRHDWASKNNEPALAGPPFPHSISATHPAENLI